MSTYTSTRNATESDEAISDKYTHDSILHWSDLFSAVTILGSSLVSSPGTCFPPDLLRLLSQLELAEAEQGTERGKRAAWKEKWPEGGRPEGPEGLRFEGIEYSKTKQCTEVMTQRY